MPPPSRRRPRALAALVLLAAVLLSGVALALGPSSAQTSDSTGTSLPDGAESAEVSRLVSDVPDGAVLPLLVVVSRQDGAALDATDLAAVEARAAALGGPVEVSGAVATVAVPVPADLSDEANTQAVADIRATARDGLPDGLVAEVTGPPAVRADLGAVFEGADVDLLLVTVLVVAVLLLVTYRSPLLWIVPLAVVGLADRVSVVLVATLSSAVGLEVDASAAGIVSVLVFGAGTNYALLLVARYRDELRQVEDRTVAMHRALRATTPTILASGGTVALSLLTLLAADLTSNRSLGFAGTVGICTAMLFGLVVLPAALVLPGRWLFWPFVPKVGDLTTAERAGVWKRLGAVVARRPAPVAAGTVVLLGGLALGVLGASTGLALTDSFRETPESVAAQRTLEEALPAGAAQPLTVVSPAGSAAEVTRAAEGVDGVSGVRPGPVLGELAVTEVVLAPAPGTAASDAALVDLRAALSGTGALVGGETAEAYDVAQATARDTRVVVPLVLLLVLAVLVVLLRALVAPVLLVASTVLSYAAALGAGWLLFDLVLGYPALDASVPLLSFLFLVALGVDYSVFLVARTREEVRRGLITRDAVLRALAATGGVITSAGILLASVFTVLGVLPLVVLGQIGVVVGLGVLLDTLVVRTVLVPAVAVLLGARYWWPGRPEAAHATAAAPAGAPVTVGASPLTSG